MYSIKSILKIVIIPIFLLGLLGFSPSPSAQGTIAVTTTIDEYADPGPGEGCSLREAITAANTDAPFGGCDAGSGTDTIAIPAGTITFTRTGNDDMNIYGDLDIYSSMNLVGVGINQTILNAAQLDRVIEIIGYYTVGISDMTLQNGKSIIYEAGGVDNYHGTVTLNRVKVINNSSATDYACGGIFSLGTMSISDSIISGNTTADVVSVSVNPFGGGICNGYMAAMTIRRSTISDNHAGNRLNAMATSYDLTAGHGGGIYNAGTLTISESLISGNHAGDITAAEITEPYHVVGGDGGGIYDEGNITMTNSTITGNHAGNATGLGTNGIVGGTGGAIMKAGTTLNMESVTIYQNYRGQGTNQDGDAGGIEAGYGSSIYLHNSIFYGNNTFNLFCGNATLISQDYNILGDLNCTVTGVTTHNLTGDPLVNALADNSGPTETLSLQLLSPAIDAGDPLSCPEHDQRGVDRPVDGNRDGTAWPDIGAYEFQPWRSFLPLIKK